MPYNRLSTARIARAAGCHPNTVRMYEQNGLIAPAPRSPKGYRLFHESHLDQMVLARMALSGSYPGRNIRRSVMSVIRTTAAGDYPAALEQAHRHLEIVLAERNQAESAADFLERWARGELPDPGGRPLQIRDVARQLQLTTDALRNWERSGLLRVPRNPANRYRLYSPVEIGRLRVIRLLRQAGYSPMAILRMLVQLDQGQPGSLREALDTPRPDEDVYSTADRWLTTLSEHEERARQIVAQLEHMVSKYAPQQAG